jgi:hypothetical protein
MRENLTPQSRNQILTELTKFTELIIFHSVNFVNSVENFLYNEQEFYALFK